MRFRRLANSVLALALGVLPVVASAKKDELPDAGSTPSDTSTPDGEGTPTPPPVEAVDWSESATNVDYQPKSESEGATWTFNPQKVQLSYGQSDTGTNFQGARILKGNEDAVVQGGGPTVGRYEDDPDSQIKRYANWQGSTFYFGVDDDTTGNAVAGIVEFFWFESSIPRGSDFYAAHIKVKSSPNVAEDWLLSKKAGWVDDWIAQWTSDGPCQHVQLDMESGGAHGSVRWDFSVPFENYKWQPVKTMQISESYGAGYSVTGDATGNAKATAQFKEGGEVAQVDADGKLTIQAKGYVNSDFKVQSQYTVTLYKWEMLVNSSGEGTLYQLVQLPHDEENQNSSGYYEYFVVIQATRGTPIHIDTLEIGGMFEQANPFWFDGEQGLSVKVRDIWLTPPRGVCLPGDVAPAGTCKSKGVCGVIEPDCIQNKWVCPVVNVFEELETSCDGLDNDCDGKVDEDLVRECSTKCGKGYETCLNARFQGCDAAAPVTEICGDGVDNDCDGTHDNGCATDTPDNAESGETDEPGPGTPDAGGSIGSSDGSEPDPIKPQDNPGNNGTGNPTGNQPPAQLPPATGGQAGCSAGATSTGTSAAAGALSLLAVLALIAFRRRSSFGT